MKNRILITFVFIFFAAVFCLKAMARTDVPGRTKSRVNDYAGIIDKGTKDHLERSLSSIPQKTPDPVEVMVATFGNIEGWSINDFALAYAEKWRQTKKGRDNGVIIFLFPQEGNIIIGVGQNLKSIITDKIVNDTVNEMTTLCSNGEYGVAVKNAAEKIVDVLDQADIPTGKPGVLKLMVLLGIGIFLGYLGRNAVKLVFKR